MTDNVASEAQTTQEEPEGERRVVSPRVSQVAWLLLSLFEAGLALRFVLKLIRGKPVSPLAAVLYAVTGFLRMRMFRL
jgi:hypothetical protein